jgi:hypothetical protein
VHGPYSLSISARATRERDKLPELHLAAAYDQSLVNFTMSANPSLSQSPPIPHTAHSPRSPPLHQFEDPPDELSEEHRPDGGDEDEGDDDIPYPEPSSEQTLLPPPNFKPFFTLIEDTTSGEHYHPYVHYVFADDDPAIVTAASMRSLGLDDTKYMAHEPQDEDLRQQSQEGASEDGDDPVVDSPLPPHIPGVREHYMIVDLGTDGRTIVDAQSLSPEWQITDKSIRTAPSFDESSPDQGYMIRIAGIEIPGKNKGKGKGQAGDDKLSEAREKTQDDLFGALDSLVQDIEGGLETAAKIAGTVPAEGQDTVVDVRATNEEEHVASET